MEKLILFYKYVSIEMPGAIVKAQRKLCESLGLRGRILIATEGINGTIAGPIEAIEAYKKAMDEHPLFADIDFKEDIGGKHCFPRLQITARPSIVNLGLEPDDAPLEETGEHLTPQQVHELLENKPDDLVVLDTRNTYEWRVGKFTDAITPPIETFRDLPHYLDEHADEFKDKQVLMYCTGGVRCERATAYLNKKGVAKKVMQIEGGIHRYIEEYPDGFFRGKNYVFDDRVTVPVNDDILASCDICTIPCDEYTHCLNATCNKLFICCAPCKAQFEETCSDTCKELVDTGKVHKRAPFRRVVIQKNQRK